MSFALSALLLGVVTALSCSLPGVFVILRRNSMLIDAISHALLPGIVIGYLLTSNLNSPILVLCAALAGLLVVAGNEWLSRTGLITGDAPQGLIFPALFAVGILLLSTKFTNLHLDTHTVLAGDLNLVAFNQITIAGFSIGASYMYFMLLVLFLNAAFIYLCYEQLKITTFDLGYAKSIGIKASLLNYAFMFLVAFTVTAAFNAAGAILVVALVIVPAASAYLISHDLKIMIALTLIISTLGAIAGFYLAYVFNAATSAGMALCYGLIFLFILGGVKCRQKIISSKIFSTDFKVELQQRP